MRITNIQKKQLFEIFKKNNLNLVDFETSGEYQEFNIKFKHDYFSFSISKVKDDTYSTSILAIDRKDAYNYSESWAITLKRFDGWSQKVSNELSSPTGWETFENTNFLNTDYEDLNSEFTQTEKIQTRHNIQELKSKIELLNLPEDRLKIIESKLDTLSVKVDELNKFDWKSLFIGTIASLIMSSIIPQELNGMLWEYIKSSFNNLKISG